MMRLGNIVRLIAAVIVVGGFACTMVLAKRFFVKAEAQSEPSSRLESLLPKDVSVSEKAVEELVERLAVDNIPDVTPGERAFESARDLLTKGDFTAAEEKLKYVNIYYPTAPSASEARRILGEMNMDRLFDRGKNPSIRLYKVRSGDSFYKIVREQNTSVDMLYQLNGVKFSDRLFPGDELVVMPLNFRLVIDLRRKVAELWDGARYIKTYELKRCTLPEKAGTITTVVVAVEAYSKQSRVNAVSPAFRGASKVVALKAPQAELCSSARKLDDGFTGATLDDADIEELALLLRVGNSVEIRY